MNQDQYHASLLNKGQPVGLGWDGITKSSTIKIYPPEKPNNTDVDDTIKRVKDNDPNLTDLNWNNIRVSHKTSFKVKLNLKIYFQNISDEKFEQLFIGLKNNTKLQALSLTNVGLTDRTALLLAEAVEKNSTLRVLNVETNFISPPVVVVLAKALLQNMSVEEFRASNQVWQKYIALRYLW